ncbi:MAG: phage integrase N-terminal SAM-like domain-containing protein [Deltaproteobacteria bacterium]|nr:phage integrase N-terminal SAM-like domain-containing protein [Deltaproteobacteria bacterium]
MITLQKIEKQRPFYIRWISNFLSFSEKSGSSKGDEGQTAAFLNTLAKTKEKWQAREAIRIFLFFLSQENEQNTGEAVSLDAQSAWHHLARQMREALRLRHLSIRTEKSYLQWLRSFYLFLNGKKPGEIAPQDVKRFLGHIALDRKVAASAQNQAVNALLFLLEQRHSAS